MEAEIGNAAGIIWHYLDQHGSSGLTAIKKHVNLPEPLVLMALGWLAREGKVTFTRDGRTLLVTLRTNQAA